MGWTFGGYPILSTSATLPRESKATKEEIVKISSWPHADHVKKDPVLTTEKAPLIMTNDEQAQPQTRTATVEEAQNIKEARSQTTNSKLKKVVQKVQKTFIPEE